MKLEFFLEKVVEKVNAEYLERESKPKNRQDFEDAITFLDYLEEFVEVVGEPSNTDLINDLKSHLIHKLYDSNFKFE